MKHIRIEENDDVRQEMKELLDIGPLPRQVDERLQHIYFQLPEKLTCVMPKRRRVVTTIFSSAGALAAMFLILFAINAANPAFAEDLPLVGGIFKQINAGTMYADTVDTQRLEEKAVDIEETPGVINDLHEINVTKAYYDGHFLHSVLEMKTEIDPSIYNIIGTVKINGVYANVLDGNTDNLLPSNNWIFNEDGSYMTEIKFAVPETFRQSEELELEYNFTFYDMSEYWLDQSQGTDDESIGSKNMDEEMQTSLTFTVSPNTEDAIYLDAQYENDGATLYSFYTSPGGTEIFMQVPVEGDYGVHAKLFTMDGRELGVISCSNHVFTGSLGVRDVDKYFYFDGLKEEYKQVVLRLFVAQPSKSDDNVDYRYIEFLIDIENEEVSSCAYYADKTSPLYYSTELMRISPVMYATYRAFDDELKAEDGYQVEFITCSGIHKSAYLTFVTPEAYRDLRVELYVNGELRASRITQLNGVKNQFIPFSEYIYDKDKIAYYEDGTVFILDSGYLERDVAVKEDLNIQSIGMGEILFQMGDEAAIKLYDSESGELLHEETVTLTLPEGAEIGDGQQLYHKGYGSYVIADIDDLE